MPAAAQDATWVLNPTVAGPIGGTLDYNGDANWTPATVPTGTATFGSTNSSTLSFSAGSTTVGGWIFNAGASAYTFTVLRQTLQFSGAGIAINGGGASIVNNANGSGTSLIQFLNASTAGSASISNNTGNGIDGIRATATIQFGGTSTAGNATMTNIGGNFGTATIEFLNASTADHATITNVNGGGTNNNSVVAFFNTSTADHATITNNRTLQFNDTSTAGNAKIVNNAVTDFFNASTAGNAIITENGNLTFHNTSTAGNATITTNSGGTTSFLNSAGGGTARFILNGTGALDISGLTTGGATVGSIEGDGNVHLGANTLAVGGNDLSTIFSGVISGIGGLTKVGGGTLVLSNITNSYTGATVVNGGTLEVDGAIAGSSSVTVNSGGTLSGNGVVGPGTFNATSGGAVITASDGGTFTLVAANGTITIVPVAKSAPGLSGGSVVFPPTTMIMSGGTLAPGNAANPTGTLNVTSDLAFQSGANYLVHVTPSAAASTNVLGLATLGGATVNAKFVNGGYISKQYTILTAGSVSGTFGVLTNANLPANFSNTLSYDATHAYLNLALNFTPPPSGPTAPNFGGSLSINQQSVANTLVNYFNTTGGIPMVYGTLTPSGLTQASGELATDSQQTTFDAMNLFMGMLTDPFMNRTDGAPSVPGASGYAEEGDASAYAATRKTDAFAMFTKVPLVPFVPRWSVWAAGYGGSQSTNSNGVVGSNNTTSSVYGTAVGADYLFSPNTIAGFALAGGGTNFSVSGMGSGRSDLFQAGAYIRHTEGPAYVLAALAYGWQDITTNRTVTAAGIEQLRAEFNANTYSGRLEGGYRFVAPWTGGIGITPYAAGQFTTFDLPGYAEQAIVGSPAFALAYAAKSVTDVRSELGIRTDKSFVMADGLLTLRTRFAWGMITIRTDRSPRPSRRCPARALSSTARRRRATPR